MSRKKKRYVKASSTPKAPPKTQTIESGPSNEDEHIVRYKAVVRSPLGEWWIENKKRVRLFAIIGGAGLLIGWLLFELLHLVF